MNLQAPSDLSVSLKLAAPSQVYVPVHAIGLTVVDNGGDVIAICFTPALAEAVARLVNSEAAGAWTPPFPVIDI